MKFNLRPPLFALYSFANRKGWLSTPWAKWTFREAYFVYKKHYEDPFWRLTKQHPQLFRQGHIVDAGANIGYTAYCFASAIDRGFSVFAFEPESTNFAELERVANRRSIRDRIKPLKKALGRADTTLDLWINEDHHGDHRIVTPSFLSSGVDIAKRERVPAVALDGFLKSEDALNNISFVKIDVQGYELEVCEGMVETLHSNPSIKIAIEYSPEHLESLGCDPKLLLTFFRERGFRPYAISRSRTGPILRAWDWTTMDKEGYMDVLFTRREIESQHDSASGTSLSFRRT